MNEQYVFTGKYREFRGYIFANGKPVTILDRATLEAVKKDETFKRVDQEERQEAPAPSVLTRACSKCGRVVVRGLFIHEKYCKGVK